MIVLLDVEWVTYPTTMRELTQLSAMRLDEAWNVVSEFHVLVCPGEPAACDWSHIAYSGYTPAQFMAGADEPTTLKQFFAWLAPEDRIGVWHFQAGKTLVKRYRTLLNAQAPQRWFEIHKQIMPYLPKCAKDIGNLYALAEFCGIELPMPAHCARNDVSVLQALLASLHVPSTELLAPKKTLRIASAAKTEAELRKERNQTFLAAENYNYYFASASGVFHRRTCPVLLRAKELSGCIRYDQAMEMHRPCKLCKPVADPEAEQKLTRRSAAKPAAFPRADETEEAKKWRKEVITVLLLGDKRITIARKNLVGCCHNIIHPGRLTQKLMEEHECLQKNCRFFEKYPEATYWRAQEQKQIARLVSRARRKHKKEQAERERTQLAEFQACADQGEEPLKIIRVQHESANVYKIYYVSQYAFRDGNRFPTFVAAVRQAHPQYRLIFRHIQAEDGHFVTIQEYLNR
jgi:hypothetical protein